MNPEGGLVVDLLLADDGFRCDIHSSRPLAAAQVFSGKPLDEVLTSLPMLFSICARAHSATLVAAMESARGDVVGDTVAAQRQALVLLETLREQVLRIFLDWPLSFEEMGARQMPATLMQHVLALMAQMNPTVLVSLQPNPRPLAPEARSQWQLLRQFLDDALFCSPAEAWLAQLGSSADALRQWAAGCETVAARFLFWLAAQAWSSAGNASLAATAPADSELASKMEDDDFIARPEGNGGSVEVSWFSRVRSQPLVAALINEQGSGIYTRSAARLVAIAEIILQLDAFFAGDDGPLGISSDVPGLAHTEAARGRLTHKVELNGGRLEKLRILAPTEWNFHPQGVAAQGLSKLQPGDEASLRQQARLLIHVIDPCVGYTLNIRRL